MVHKEIILVYDQKAFCRISAGCFFFPSFAIYHRGTGRSGGDFQGPRDKDKDHFQSFRKAVPGPDRQDRLRAGKPRIVH